MLTKSKIFVFSVVALLALNGCGDRGADIGGSGAGGAGGGDGSHYPAGQDTDKDGLPDNKEDPNGNGIVDPGETDRLNPDTDGDGLLDGDAQEIVPSIADGSIPKSLQSCEPAQPAGYRGYNYQNGMWVVKDCDGDGYVNGTEDNESLGLNHYISDPYSASSACFVFKSKVYCEAHTTDGKTWLDRNLGADKFCTAKNDAPCYGDLYQWGRTTDGHEKDNSVTGNANPTEAMYVWRSDKYEVVSGGDYDWLTKDGDEAVAGDKQRRKDYWSDHTTGEVCPDGWYIPNVSEANDTMNAEGIVNADTAFNSHLKIGLNGDRPEGGGLRELQGTNGGYYTTDFGSDNTVRSITVSNTDVKVSSPVAAKAFGIRCLKK